jgi:autotransporter passenger strand-loop-strand repeat protein
MSVSVSNGKILVVSLGQTSGGVIVLSGGELTVDPGGTAIDSILSSGASDARRLKLGLRNLE